MIVARRGAVRPRVRPARFAPRHAHARGELARAEPAALPSHRAAVVGAGRGIAIRRRPPLGTISHAAAAREEGELHRLAAGAPVFARGAAARAANALDLAAIEA